MIKYNTKYWIYKFIDYFQKKTINLPIVKSSDEAIDLIIEKRLSVSRFGDGELLLIKGKDISYQNYSDDISKRLKDILKEDNNRLLVCVPNVFGSLDEYVEDSKKIWTIHMGENRKKWFQILDQNKIYYDAFLSRPYMIYSNKNNCEYKFKNLKRIWQNRDIIIVEGEKSRLGVGNDLFDNTNSISRIICPSTNAFDSYDSIIYEVKKHNKGKLILLALGPTASILAYDLSKAGYQAIDIGHIDIEYEWFLRKSKKKEKIEGKYTNEVIGGSIVSNIKDEKYINETICKIN